MEAPPLALSETLWEVGPGTKNDSVVAEGMMESGPPILSVTGIFNAVKPEAVTVMVAV